MRGETLELLCFQVGDRVFAVDIMGIGEILRNQTVTPVPRAPDHVAGVVNLRGELVPVLDLHRTLLGNPADGPLEEPKLVVVRARGRRAGLLVDQVLEVISAPLSDLTPVPGTEPDAPDGVVVAAFRRALEGVGETVVLLLRLGPLLEEGVGAEPLGALP